MAVDWDAELLSPVMAEFGEGDSADQSTWPIYTYRDDVSFALADAVFDRAYTDVTLEGDGSENTTTKPCLGVRLSLFPMRQPLQNDTIFIPSVAGYFIVKDVRPDGHGHAKLILMGPHS